ncbi:hypothetical protein [Herbiconiux liangxiaofengii]|uniref:hypothetical protein n=1 Tax=Herbiconiux liangxiaofengii TaxID=3342795 RepID=UPI0035B98279
MTPRRPGRHGPGSRSAAAKRLLTTTILTGAAVVLAVAAAGTTSARLTSAAAVAGAVVRSGTAQLDVTAPLGLGTGGLYPGASVTGSAVLTNGGQVPLSLGVSGLAFPGPATAFSGSLTVGLSIVDTGATCPAVSTTWTGTATAATATDLGVRVAPGGAKRLCVSVSLAVSAPAAANGSTPASFTLGIDGRQVA